MRNRSVVALLSLLCLGVFVFGCSSETPPTQEAEGASNTTPDRNTGTAAAKPKQPATDPMHPLVEVATTHGTITIELDMEQAPVTSTNFLDYVNSSHYNGTVFHYVEDGAMILGGGFTPEFEQKPTSPPIRNEAHNGLKNVRGSIAMSRYPDSIDSATCQFFINLGDNEALDFKDQSPEGYGYCVFGRVVKGMEVADKIAKLPVQDSGDFVSTPQEPVVIKSAKLPTTVR
ncbi:MAG: peptidylprolyl isomerase [Planctomycetales bacterium]|nr:peptidylprolyl isomerase [Planctomycetales bacterium]